MVNAIAAGAGNRDIIGWLMTYVTASGAAYFAYGVYYRVIRRVDPEPVPRAAAAPQEPDFDPGGEHG